MHLGVFNMLHELAAEDGIKVVISEAMPGLGACLVDPVLAAEEQPSRICSTQVNRCLVTQVYSQPGRCASGSAVDALDHVACRRVAFNFAIRTYRI